MKLKTNRAAFTKAFHLASQAVPGRTTTEILKNVLLQCDDSGTGSLVSGNGEITQVVKLSGIDGSRCVVLLPCEKTLAILRELDGDEITLDIGDNKVSIKSSDSVFKLQTVDAEGYPPPPVFDYPADQVWTVNAVAVGKMLSRVIYATDQNSTRYAMSGIMLDLRDDKSLTMAATDSRRLSVMTEECGAAAGVSQALREPLIPLPAAKLLMGILHQQSSGEMLQIVPLGASLVFRVGDVVLSTQCLTGRFPNYKMVIPAQFNVSVELPGVAITRAVRQACIVTNEESRAAEFKLTAGNLTITTSAADVGESTIKLPVAFDGEPIHTVLDPRYAVEFLKNLDPAETVVFSLNDSEGAVMFRSGNNCRYIMMPLERM